MAAPAAAAPAAATAAASSGNGVSRMEFRDRKKEEDVRMSNITAAKGIASAIRTSLGPRGMDKMIQAADGSVTITNDGATILEKMRVIHPAAKMLVELSKAQDIEAGDGTTSVVVIAGALLAAVEKLLNRGLHPSVIAQSFQSAQKEAVKIIESMSVPVDLTDRETLLKLAATSLNSKVVSQHSNIIAPISVDSIMRVIDPKTATSVDLKDVRVVKRMGGTIEDCELVDGIVFTQKPLHTASGLTRVEKAKIGLIQFCLSAPKADMENQIIVSDYSQMDRVIKEERDYLLDLCKKIKKTGCNVLLIQKSILRDAVSDLALHFLAKLKIMVIKDIERDDIEFIYKTLGCQPVASIDHFTAERLGTAELVEEDTDAEVVRVTGVPHTGKTISVLVRGSNKLVLDEAERSIHDAQCVMRCLVKKRALIVGGGAPEIEVARRLTELSNTATGADSYCFRAYAEALEVRPHA
jgi:T-complex protein 1 subunit delta